LRGGAFHNLGIKTDGTLWAWGSNEYGQLGDGTTIDRLTPVQIGNKSWQQVTCDYNKTLAIDSEGKLWAWGFNEYYMLVDTVVTHFISPVQIGSGSDWTQIACGSSHFLALKPTPSSVFEAPKLSKSFQIIPNPNQGKFRIVFESELESKAEVEIYSITGKLKLRINKLSLRMGTNEQEFDIEDLSSGKYNLIIKFSNGKFLRESLLIVK
jgi:alpha-tubulin suppressor-like RCC1 family protein